jgi:3-hydroxyacyl-[acyl-carrier-protein] dehydratase
VADGPTTGEVGIADIVEIMAMIPHRYPMLLVDRVRDLQPDKSAVGIKNVTINEPQFQGHFPTAPIMPGVMIVEAMAQTAAVLVVSTLGPDARGKHVYFMSIDDCRFRRPVRPGDVMHIHIDKERSRGAVWRFVGKVLVDGALAAEARFSAMIVDSA